MFDDYGERTEEDDYRADLIYEVYMQGGNIDDIDDDRVRDYWEEDLDVSEAAWREMRHQKRHEDDM